MFGLTDKIIGALALVLALALAWQTYRLHGAEMSSLRASNDLANGQAAWADERAIAAEKLVQATAKNRETEQQLTAQAEKAEHEKQTQIAAVSARADDLRRRLRNAEASAATARLVPGLPAASAPGDIAGERDRPELSGPLGYDVVSEAERADTIRFQLAACTRQYNAAREAMRTLKP
jgi:small-conductance mechanosensitive channel